MYFYLSTEEQYIFFFTTLAISKKLSDYFVLSMTDKKIETAQNKCAAMLADDGTSPLHV